jgi:glycosyltransferase involved in cell wall biosynthesis
LQHVPGDYAGYCFCDQDDVWLPNKIERSLKATADAALPIVYGARTRLVDVDGKPIGFSPLFQRPKSFENALVQSMAGGNTMMLNPAAFALVAESAARTGFVTHDWWAYILTTGCGGKAIYDPEPNLHYRQHANNIIGKNSGLKATLRRIAGVKNGQLRAWTASNIAGLDACADMLSPSARVTLDHLKHAHISKPPMGLMALYRSRVYRQNAQGNAMLWLAGAMGWL